MEKIRQLPLINLAFNARDAMPDAAASLDDDQDYVSQGHRHRDDREVLQRAMEPFFTPSGVGQGSGLGLAMAHFVAQSGGHVSIHSEPGTGTTVKLYLPAFSAADEAMEEEVPVSKAPVRGSESILLLEHDGAVRRFLATALTRLGYTVLSAENAKAATDLVRSAGKIGYLSPDVKLLEAWYTADDFVRPAA